VNDSTPLPAGAYEIARLARRNQTVDFVPGVGERANHSFNGDLELAALVAAAARRWRSDLGPFHPAALDLEFNSHQGGVLGSGDLLWLRSRDALQLSTRLSKWALQFAVMANGGALVALAFTIQSADGGSGAAVAPAVVLGLGLLTAAISLLAYLKFQFAAAVWPVRVANRRTRSFWLAAISGAGSYATLFLAAFWLLPVVSWY
jgi:hypothetical protein